MNKYEKYYQEQTGRALPKRIRISCDFDDDGCGIFENITPGSVHELVTPINNHFHDNTGVWIMGSKCPVKVFEHEFEVIDEPVDGDYYDSPMYQERIAIGEC